MTAETKNRARLFFRDIELGEIVEEEADFLRLFGKFHPVTSESDSPLRREIQRYIEYSIAADKTMQEESSEKWDAFMEENEAQFIDLIESEDWYLKYSDRIELIMIPILVRTIASSGAGIFRPIAKTRFSPRKPISRTLPLRSFNCRFSNVALAGKTFSVYNNGKRGSVRARFLHEGKEEI